MQNSLAAKAMEYGHSTAGLAYVLSIFLNSSAVASKGMAGTFGRLIGARMLVLNHFSPRAEYGATRQDQAGSDDHEALQVLRIASAMLIKQFDCFNRAMPTTLLF